MGVFLECSSRRARLEIKTLRERSPSSAESQGAKRAEETRIGGRPTAFGSAKNVVIAVPFVSSAVFPANEVLVAGSDGLFDVIPAKSCVKIARAALAAGRSAESTAQELCTMARARKSRDDISVVVVFSKEEAVIPKKTKRKRERKKL
jgi:serine/threonine protein phosphatase PrpC